MSPLREGILAPRGGEDVNSEYARQKRHNQAQAQAQQHKLGRFEPAVQQQGDTKQRQQGQAGERLFCLKTHPGEGDGGSGHSTGHTSQHTG